MRSKKAVSFVLVVILSLIFVFGGHCFAQVRVEGYYRQDGTYVQPHYRSNPNSTVRDNYNYKGNINPYTGKEGANYYRDDSTSEYYRGTLPKPGYPW